MSAHSEGLETSLDWESIGDSQIGSALEEIGFIVLKRKPAMETLFNNALGAAKDFFGLEDEKKFRYNGFVNGGLTGYLRIPADPEYTLDEESALAGNVELWHIGRGKVSTQRADEFHPENHWPEELPNFKEQCFPLFSEMDAISEKVLVACARHLGLSDSTFSGLVEGGWSTLRLIRYPAVEKAVPGEMRGKAHTDATVLTLFSCGSSEGLEVQGKDGEWYKLPAGNGEIIVGAGEILETWSGGVFKSATHRVTYQSGAERTALPFFVAPRPEVIVQNMVGAPEGSKRVSTFLKERLGIGP